MGAMNAWRWVTRGGWTMAGTALLVGACATAVEEEGDFEDDANPTGTASSMGGMMGTGGDDSVGSTSNASSSNSSMSSAMGGMGGFGGMGGMGPTSTVSSTTASSTSVTSVTSSTSSTSTTTGGGCSGIMCGSVCCVDPLNNPNFPINLNPNAYEVCCPDPILIGGDCGAQPVGNTSPLLCFCTDGC